MHRSSVNSEVINVKPGSIWNSPLSISADLSKQLDGLIRFNEEEMNAYFPEWECPDLVQSPISDTTLSPLLRTPPTLHYPENSAVPDLPVTEDSILKANRSVETVRSLSRTQSTGSNSSQEQGFPDFLGLSVSTVEGDYPESGISEFKKAALGKFGMKNTVRIVKSAKNTVSEPQIQETIDPSLLQPIETPLSLQSTIHHHVSRNYPGTQTYGQPKGCGVLAQTIPFILTDSSLSSTPISDNVSQLSEEIEDECIDLGNGLIISGWTPEQTEGEEPCEGIIMDIDYINPSTLLNSRMYMNFNTSEIANDVGPSSRANSSSLEASIEKMQKSARQESHLNVPELEHRRRPRIARNLSFSPTNRETNSIRRYHLESEYKATYVDSDYSPSSPLTVLDDDMEDTPEIPVIMISSPSDAKVDKFPTPAEENHVSVSGEKLIEPQLVSPNFKPGEQTGRENARVCYSPSVSGLLNILDASRTWSIFSGPYGLARIPLDHRLEWTGPYHQNQSFSSLRLNSETSSKLTGPSLMTYTCSYNSYLHENERKRKHTNDMYPTTFGSSCINISRFDCPRLKRTKVIPKSEVKSPLPPLTWVESPWTNKALGLGS